MAEQKPMLLSIQKIWNESVHNALTDLIRYQDKWICVFREGDTHVGGRDGRIRFLHSHDGVEWSPLTVINVDGIDLRDPKLSITPTGQLMLLVGGTEYTRKGEYIARQPMVTFSDDGENWGPLQKILEPHEWLWRVTWFKGKAYGASYRQSDPTNIKKEWLINLFESDDGVNYRHLAHWDIPGYPNETTLRFQKNGEMVALVRRDKRRDNATWMGYSQPPYTDWDWYPTDRYFGGPNFLILPDGEMWGAGRLLALTPYGYFQKTTVAKIEGDRIRPKLILPSGGWDCSYPGMVYHEDVLWVSYYSSHEENTAIYIARLSV